MPESPSLESPPATGTLLEDVRAGLRAPRKAIPCKYLYDERGSRLFDRIGEQPEYYPTRTELLLLNRSAPAIARALGPACELVEYGAGATRKIRQLLGALDRPARYMPVDIAASFLKEAAAGVAADFPGLAIRPVAADYTRPLTLPEEGPPAARRVVWFPGSTIGNFTPAEARAFLQAIAETIRGGNGSAGGLLIGVDLAKDPDILEAAYNDAAGVTAAFTLNLLYRLNRQLGTDFRPEGFAYEARWEPGAPGRVRMQLTSRRDQQVTLAGERFHFRAGEPLHTENSYKYTCEQFLALAGEAGFRHRRTWTDPLDRMAIFYLEGYSGSS